VNIGLNRSSISDGWEKHNKAVEKYISEPLKRGLENASGLAAEGVVKAGILPSELNKSVQFISDGQRRLAITVTAAALMHNLHQSPVINLPETLNPSAKAAEINQIQEPRHSMINIHFNNNLEEISKKKNHESWSETEITYTNKHPLRFDDILELYEIRNAEGKKLKVHELGSSFVSIATENINKLINEANPYYEPKLGTDTKVKVPQEINFIIDSGKDEKAPKVFNLLLRLH